LKVKVTGSLSLEKKLKELKNMKTKEKVSFDELFNEKFMIKYTNFNSINELMVKCNISTEDDLTTNFDLLEKEIKHNTKFSSWEDMKHTAAQEHIKKKLDKIFK
jgi:hypothetical protein